MAGRVLLFLHHASFERAYQATSLGLTARAMGDEVYFVLSFEALASLARGDFGAPATERERRGVERAVALGVPSPAQLLVEARGLGARVVACETMVLLAGLTAEGARAVLDEVLGLPTLVRLWQDARALSL